MAVVLFIAVGCNQEPASIALNAPLPPIFEEISGQPAAGNEAIPASAGNSTELASLGEHADAKTAPRPAFRLQDGVNLLPKADFSSWNELSAPPPEWGAGSFGGVREGAAYMLHEAPSGQGIIQTWEAPDGISSIFHLFGIESSVPDTTSIYKVEMLSSEVRGRFVASVWGTGADGSVERISEIQNVVAPLTEFYFEARACETIRIVVACLAVDPPPAITWQSWGLFEIRQEDLVSTISSAFLRPSLASSEYTSLSTAEDLGVLDAALEEIFPGDEIPAAEPAVLKILSYSTQILKGGPFVSDLGSEQLSKGVGFCGGRSAVMVALCRRFGIPARSVQFRNVGSKTDTHVAVEAYYENRWHYFDPSYALFLYSENSYSGEGSIYSVRELFAEPQKRAHPLALDVSYFTGLYDADFDIVPFQDVEGREVYSVLFTNSFPNRPHEKGAGAVFPLDFHFTESGKIMYGQIDQSSQDFLMESADGIYVRNRGDDFLGAIAGKRNASHLVALDLPGPGICSVTYHFRGQTLRNCLGVVEMRDCLVLDTIFRDSPVEENAWSWTVNFVALNQRPELLTELRQAPNAPELSLAVPIDALEAEYIAHGSE
ncbi:MAG: hypothetical protein KJ052_04720 [Candidatus Hydrogenedentes bacterium]|nr:hypothetical protein [Candidatus Hydrogenedentota bacterium]